MSWNNITPWWVIHLDGAKKKGIKHYWEHLHSDEAKKTIPPHVRQHLIDEARVEMEEELGIEM